MPVVPQPNASGIVRTLGFNFDFAEAFTSACVEQGVESVEAYATLAATVTTQFTANGVGAVGTSSDIQAPNTSLWALSKEATADALTAASNASVALESANIAISTADGAKETADANLATLNTQFTANGVGAVGTSTDIEAPNTSLWALSKQAWADAHTAATNANAAFENAATALETANAAQTTANANLGTLNTQFTENGVGAVGTSTDAQANNTSLWALAKQALDDALLGQTAANAAGSIVGTAGDAPSLVATCFAYAKQAEIDAQTGITNALKAYTYNLTGTTINATITSRGTGIVNAFPATTFTLATSITFNIPPNWSATNNVYIDGWALYNFQASINTFWGARYITNTYATPTDILGSTTAIADALSFPTSAQVYIPVNLVIPPTHLTVGGTITLSFYGYITTGSNYFSAPPVVAGRVGLALD